MQGNEMRQIRERLGMQRVQFARALGYTGTDRNDETRIRRYENQCEKYPIPLYIARLAWLIDGVMASAREEPPELWPEMLTDDGTGIDWPQWPGYDYSHEPDEEVAS